MWRDYADIKIYFPDAKTRKVVHTINPTIASTADSNRCRQIRVVAYCRVSTKQEEQLNSYETQVKHYTEKIRGESKWKLVEIFADEGTIYGEQQLKI